MAWEMQHRVESRFGPEASKWTRVLDGARIGARPASRPSGRTWDDGVGAVVVLSTVCASCKRLALTHATWWPFLANRGALIALSGPTEEVCARFLADTGLSTTHQAQGSLEIDPRGEWLRTEMGVETSPSLLRFDAGALVGAWAFSSADGLLTLLEDEAYR